MVDTVAVAICLGVIANIVIEASVDITNSVIVGAAFFKQL